MLPIVACAKMLADLLLIALPENETRGYRPLWTAFRDGASAALGRKHTAATLLHQLTVWIQRRISALLTEAGVPVLFGRHRVTPPKQIGLKVAPFSLEPEPALNEAAQYGRFSSPLRRPDALCNLCNLAAWSTNETIPFPRERLERVCALFGGSTRRVRWTVGGRAVGFDDRDSDDMRSSLTRASAPLGQQEQEVAQAARALFGAESPTIRARLLQRIVDDTAFLQSCVRSAVKLELLRGPLAAIPMRHRVWWADGGIRTSAIVGLPLAEGVVWGECEMEGCLPPRVAGIRALRQAIAARASLPLPRKTNPYSRKDLQRFKKGNRRWMLPWIANRFLGLGGSFRVDAIPMTEMVEPGDRRCTLAIGGRSQVIPIGSSHGAPRDEFALIGWLLALFMGTSSSFCSFLGAKGTWERESDLLEQLACRLWADGYAASVAIERDRAGVRSVGIRRGDPANDDLIFLDEDTRRLVVAAVSASDFAG